MVKRRPRKSAERCSRASGSFWTSIRSSPLICACLKKGKVHVAINSGRDIFEEDNFEHIKGSELLQRFRSEVGYITDLIDTLLTVDTLYKQQDLQS